MGFFERPVLAIEAVEVAGFKGNGQVVKTHFRAAIVGETRMARARAPGADPVGNAVRWERIIVKGDKGARPAIGSHARFAPVSYPAVPFLVLARPAAQKTKFAVDSVRIGCRAGGQTEHLPGFGVNLFDSAPALVRPIPNAGGANTYAGGNVVETITAQEAFGPFSG
jgi:hypothetical protein